VQRHQFDPAARPSSLFNPHHTRQALRPGVRSCIAAASGGAADVQLQPDQVINLGRLRIKCLATPGHTNGCMSFHLPPAAAGEAGVVFSGDALLIRSCGRTDFQQGENWCCNHQLSENYEVTQQGQANQCDSARSGA
jgi:glyoxylase-like metal-dependent hydrolase (beta-lactamase superfamily II)